MQNKNIRVIAVDPGYERLGIAIIEKSGGAKEELVFSECFKTSAKLSHEKRLALLGQEIKKVIEKYEPTDMAIEELFFSGNQKTAMKVSEARGVIIYEGSLKNLNVYEYKPVEIKIAVTGYGKSTKNQVIAMVKRLIKTPEKTKIDDEFDAIATGLTHIASKRFV
ncbi:MAG: crossover junction endodeoxyribonuclease RuvC [Candidatus Paceibacterota bacterium]